MQQTKDFQGPISLDDGKVALAYLLDQFPASAQVDAYEMYTDIFPGMQTSTQVREEGEDHQPNPILLFRQVDPDTGDSKTAQRILFSDRLRGDCEEYIEGNSFALVSGLSYLGRKNKLHRAVRLNEFVIDVDSVPAFGVAEYLRFSSGDPSVPPAERLPRATYITYSGTGMHLHFVLTEPVPLYPDQKGRAKAFKDAITPAFWYRRSITTLSSVQYQGISQGFRSPGSVNGKYGDQVVIHTLRTGPKLTIQEIAEPLRAHESIDKAPLDWDPHVYKRDGRLTLAEAKELYPDWVPGSKGIPKWKSHRSLYDWWVNKLMDNRVEYGHRYHSMYVMAAMAKKCDVPKATLASDIMTRVFPKLAEAGEYATTPPLTEQDARDAIATYDLPKVHLLTRADAERLSGLIIPPKKKNGYTRQQMIKIASMHRDLKYPDGSWRSKEGRGVTLDKVVEAWRVENPLGTKTECQEETGISMSTVSRHWGDETSRSELIVMQWRFDNEDGNKSQCSRETGLSRNTVAKYWSSSELSE